MTYISFLLRRVVVLAGVVVTSGSLLAQNTLRGDSTERSRQLKGVVIKASNGVHLKGRTENTDLIGQAQLVRAACCNLGESFTTNPSVDVSYSDAATGARQIKLLGLSGTYVQMLTENVPNLRGASLPYSLGYVPGPWMQSIQVSKGASSVKNGYESTTGQINIEYLKPQLTDGVRGNLYYDIEQKLEANVDGSIHLNDNLSTSLLLHAEDRQKDHDANGDGFMDMPKLRQYNVMHRWAYVSDHWISQLALRVLRDERQSGQSNHANLMTQTSTHTSSGTSDAASSPELYRTTVTTNRYEMQWKNGFPINADKHSSVALMVHGSWHDGWNTFGHTTYDVRQKNGYAQLMYETDLTEAHSISVGASVNHDYHNERIDNIAKSDHETTSGLYLQYTYKPSDRLTVMPGIRWDYSDRYHGFFTPRLHVKYTPWEVLTLRASAGKGYRTPHALAENVTLMASGRTITVNPNLRQEEAWNYGISAGLNIPILGRHLELNTEYYYTHFINQMVINFDGAQGAHTLVFENLDGKSFSHTVQIDATYPFFEGFTATAAFRLNDVKCTYDGVLRQKPLTSRYKGMLSLSYKTPMELWHFDVTGQLNGGGDLYNAARPIAGEHTTYPAYFMLQAQVTREFRHFSLYVGGENLTNYKISNPIIAAQDPWSPQFDATQVWGPTTGAMAYIGLRFKFEKN